MAIILPALGSWTWSRKSIWNCLILIYPVIAEPHKPLFRRLLAMIMQSWWSNGEGKKVFLLWYKLYWFPESSSSFLSLHSLVVIGHWLHIILEPIWSSLIWLAEYRHENHRHRYHSFWFGPRGAAVRLILCCISTTVDRNRAARYSSSTRRNNHRVDLHRTDRYTSWILRGKLNFICHLLPFWKFYPRASFVQQSRTDLKRND